ncbi:hypothetical protein B0180_05275 [Moraxella canis]|uniref:Uncharacterized protein n=1 Tax=Moraxella canis TaxID=90239 RepID=A0A1S9ZJW0_9GAMM|nr:hypothetical protein B0180_05275 [Moraxella canis]
MNKILIVGHKESHYQALDKILQGCGMAPALLSHTHQLSPLQITDKLLRVSKPAETQKQIAPSAESKPKKNRHHAHRAPSQLLEPKTSQSEVLNPYHQKSPKKVWDNLSFDLILANAEQPLWGWSDAQAVSLLEYWAQFDEDFVFVLTYDKPSDVLVRLLDGAGQDDLSEGAIEQALKDWSSYNQALLEFQQKYPNRCLLVNGEQVIYSAKNYVSAVSDKITWQMDSSVADDQLLAVSDLQDKPQLSEMSQFFAEQLLLEHDKVNQLFMQLQAQADLPLALQKRTFNTLSLLKETIAQQKQLESTQEQLLATEKEFQSQTENLKQAISSAKADHDKDIQTLKVAQGQLADQQQENTLIISQLHQVQEELEKYYLETKKSTDLLNKEKKKSSELEKRAAELNKKSDELNQSVAQLTKEKQAIHEQKVKLDELVKQESQKLAALKKQSDDEVARLTEQNKKLTQENSVKANENNSSMQQENELLIRQLHQVQEELEKYYLENQQLKLNNQSQNNSVNAASSQVQSKQTVYYGAADRIKQDLPYRLGSTMVSHSKSTKDLAKLPLALMKEYRQFQKDEHKELPPVEAYQDANEAEKVKKHLSYRLGKTLVDGVKSPKSMVDLPVKLGREIVGFKK